jgi:glycosyltransferase involved in cell wall biosynthesis
VTISRHNVDWFSRNVSPGAERKLEVVHCGVDLEHIAWRPDGRSEGLIIGVGRLQPIKGFDTLIEALALARRNGAIFRCKLIGEGPMRAELEPQVQSHGLRDHVEFMGAQPQESVREWLEKASIFALPCQVSADGGRDGIPVALMEAMASGCAVVSCRTSGVPELISHDEHGLLVAERDAFALSTALQRLLDDSFLRRRLATAARARIEQQFDARKEARKLHGLMMRVMPDVA